MATGRVNFIGTLTATPAEGGRDITEVADGDFTTFFAAAAADSQYFYMDMVGNAIVDQIRVAARESDRSAAHQLRVNGGKIESSTASSFASPTTIATLGSYPTVLFNCREWTTVAVTTSTARRYWRFLGANNSYASLAEFRFDGPPAASVPDRPMPVDVSPAGGRYPGGVVNVTMTCETTSAAIYYTTDGSTPDNTDTLYSGAFSLTIGASAKTLKAVAYDATCSTTLGEVVTHVFNPWGFKPNEAMYDTDGVLIEAHGGDILDNRARDGYYYWYGQTANLLNNNPGVGLDTHGNFGVWCYKSTDLLNWQRVGRILDNTAQNYEWMERPRILYNDAGENYVLHVRGRDLETDTGYLCVAVSDSPDSGWSYVDDNTAPDGGQLRDFHLYKNGANAYLIWTTNTVVKAQALTSNFQELTGAVTTIITGDREGIAVFDHNGYLHLVTSSSNYYDADSTFGVRVVSKLGLNPLTGWASMTVGTTFESNSYTLFAADPVGGNFNGQPTSIVRIGDSYVYLADHWDATELYDSRYVFLPLTFIGASTVRASIPASFDLSYVIGGSGGGKGLGGIGGPTGRVF
jgi:hypothetical protein